MDNIEVYIPISCTFYDYLEEAGTLKKESKIEFWEDGDQTEINACIKTLFIKNKVEYMQLESGQNIRLDHLISFNDKLLPKVC